jgi:DNA-binding NarL/FixJ family response regulator
VFLKFLDFIKIISTFILNKIKGGICMTSQEREARRDKVVKMYTTEGKSMNEIAKNLNISWDSVKRDLVTRNIPIISKRN